MPTRQTNTLECQDSLPWPSIILTRRKCLQLLTLIIALYKRLWCTPSRHLHVHLRFQADPCPGCHGGRRTLYSTTPSRRSRRGGWRTCCILSDWREDTCTPCTRARRPTTTTSLPSRQRSLSISTVSLTNHINDSHISPHIPLKIRTLVGCRCLTWKKFKTVH